MTNFEIGGGSCYLMLKLCYFYIMIAFRLWKTARVNTTQSCMLMFVCCIVHVYL